MIVRSMAAILLVALISVTGCKKKIDPKNDEPIPNDISQFIFNGLNDYYLWVQDVDKLSEYSYESNNDWYAYLNGFGTEYEDLFDDLLYQKDVIDKWSWIVDDWEAQEQSFSGISKSMGYDFRLVFYGGGDDLFAYVRYVLPDSPADIAGVERGDIFTAVDGQSLNINNYYDLLFAQDDYQIDLAEIVGNIISPLGESRSLSAVILQENPVFMAEILDVGDGQKTAYLVYNAFTSDFDAELNDAFGYFISEGASRLILDLRYNGGGSIRTAVHLASMIYSTDDTKMFSQSKYNSGLQNYLVSTYGGDFLRDYFTPDLDTTTLNYSTMPPLPAINSMGLSEIYIITTSSTASASEMIINGLSPYIDVIQVGGTTTGKYVGSLTVKDYYTTGSLNTEHKWAMQPVASKIANSLNETGFVDGFSPDISVEEDIADLKPFGDFTEAMLAATITHIMGGKSANTSIPGNDIKHYKTAIDSKDMIPFSKDMYLRYPKFDLDEYFLINR